MTRLSETSTLLFSSLAIILALLFHGEPLLWRSLVSLAVGAMCVDLLMDSRSKGPKVPAIIATLMCTFMISIGFFFTLAS